MEEGEASHGAAALLQPVTWSGFSPGGAEIIFRSALVTLWTERSPGQVGPRCMARICSKWLSSRPKDNADTDDTDLQIFIHSRAHWWVSTGGAQVPRAACPALLIFAQTQPMPHFKSEEKKRNEDMPTIAVMLSHCSLKLLKQLVGDRNL